jgi:hypothetical protein
VTVSLEALERRTTKLAGALLASPSVELASLTETLRESGNVGTGTVQLLGVPFDRRSTPPLSVTT